MSTLTLQPDIAQQFFDNNGAPLVGGLIYTYAAGTSTPQATYADSGMVTANTNPIVLDSSGRANIFWLSASYDITVTTSAGVTVFTKSAVPSTGISANTVGWQAQSLYGDPNCPITATSYPSGATFDKCHAGTAWYAQDSANLIGTFALEAMILSVSGVTVTAAFMNLSSAPDSPIVSIASTNTTGTRVRSNAITFASPGSSLTYGVKVKVSAGTGYVWGVSIVQTA